MYQYGSWYLPTEEILVLVNLVWYLLKLMNQIKLFLKEEKPMTAGINVFIYSKTDSWILRI